MDYREKKEMFERKKAYSNRRMKENSEIDTLTEEEHDLLAELCTMRHEMHSCGESMYIEINDLNKYFTDLEIKIKDEILNVDCTDMEFYDGFLFDMEEESVEIDSDEYEERYKDSIELYYEQKGNLNDEIERFLKKIDEKYQTNYCPTRIARSNLV